MSEATEEKGFKKELTALLNRYGFDNACAMPDYILADYVEKCLQNFCAAIQHNISHTKIEKLRKI